MPSPCLYSNTHPQLWCRSKFLSPDSGTSGSSVHFHTYSTHQFIYSSSLCVCVCVCVCVYVCVYVWTCVCVCVCVFILKPIGYHTSDQRFHMCGDVVSRLFWATSVPTSKRCHWLIVLLKGRFYSECDCVCVRSLHLRWSRPLLESVPLTPCLPVRLAALSSQKWA